MRPLAVVFFLIGLLGWIYFFFGCSSRPTLDVPERPAERSDAGLCDPCWDACSVAPSRKVASICSQECNEICHAEGRY